MLDSSDHDTFLEQGLAAVDRPRRVAFAASCTERLMSCYSAFSVEQSWGKYQVLRDILDTVWDSLAGELPQQQYVDNASRVCEQEWPDSDDHPSFLRQQAECGISALLHTLAACIEDGTSHAIRAAGAVTDSIDGYLISMGDPRTGYLVDGADLFTDSQDTHIRELAISRFREVDTIANQIYQWALDSPLMNAELQKQRSDLRLLQSADALNDLVIAYLRRLSSLEGIQPFARWLINPRTRR